MMLHYRTMPHGVACNSVVELGDQIQSKFPVVLASLVLSHMWSSSQSLDWRLDFFRSFLYSFSCASDFNQTAMAINCNIVRQIGTNWWPIKQEDLFLTICWFFIRSVELNRSQCWPELYIFLFMLFSLRRCSFLPTLQLRRKYISVPIDRVLLR